MADPEAGFYVDPTARNHVRYWDGTAWTDQAGSPHMVIRDPAEVNAGPPSSEAPKPPRFGKPSSRATTDRHANERVLFQGWCRVHAGSNAYQCQVVFTDTNLFVNQRWNDSKPPYRPYLGMPLSEIASIAVVPMSDARSEYGWRITTGFLHGPTQIAAISAIEITLRHGPPVMLSMNGAAPEVNHALQPVLAILSPSADSPQVPDEGDRYDQLRKIASLRDDGILTDEEFECEKRRILE